MSENINQLNELLAKLNSIIRKQEVFGREINDLRDEIRKLMLAEKAEEQTTEIIKDVAKETFSAPKPIQTIQHTISSAQTTYKPNVEKDNPNQLKRNFEKIIGENLISKIGIAILILGVGIGTKYAIEHELISPLTRIIMGYLVGIGLLGFAIKLKKNYDNFSAVLLSGAMAIMYFITFAAYNFFDLIPQTLAFVLMVVFTIFTVIAALNYNKQVISHIGLVGAYAVPFLLSDGSGKVLVLFGYMAIINIGILILAFRKYWKYLNYVAFALTWIIFISWYFSSYEANIHFPIAIIFSFVFFASFYITSLAYKLSEKEKFELTDVILILSNTFIFYGTGYALLDNYSNGSQLLGLFTLCNAILHFGVSVLIYKQKLADRNLFYLVSGLVLVFIAIAIPVQLDGNWVTLLWAGEAALLFWIGRTRKVQVYEGLSYVLMCFASFSMIQDWIASSNIFNNQTDLNQLPFINIQFLTSILFIAAFTFIFQLNRSVKYPSVLIFQNDFKQNVSNLISAVTLLTIYMTFFIEIASLFDQYYLKSAVSIGSPSYQIHNYSIIAFKTCWLINYSLFFSSMLCYTNAKKIDSKLLTKINLLLSVLGVFIFLTVGLYSLSSLRESYLSTQSSYFTTSILYLIFRYISFIFVALVVVVHSLFMQRNYLTTKIKNASLIFIHITILWILSSELINWMDIAGSSDSYKLGITILWGVYSLAMIVLGIWKQNKILRIAAIILFGITLSKLFLYDITSLTAIAKTVVLVSLGILLLIISFLYNKYKHFIFDENEN